MCACLLKVSRFPTPVVDMLAQTEKIHVLDTQAALADSRPTASPSSQLPTNPSAAGATASSTIAERAAAAAAASSAAAVASERTGLRSLSKVRAAKRPIKELCRHVSLKRFADCVFASLPRR